MPNCQTPVILAGAVEGSLHLLVNTPGYADGVLVRYSETESAQVSAGKALIPVSTPFESGQRIVVTIDNADCKTSSCEIIAEAKAAFDEECTPDVCPAEDILTGALICDGIDLYREAHDGICGFKSGILVIADCIYCGGVNPNCEE